MRFNRIASLSKIILLIAICLSTSRGLAQSTTDLAAHYVEATPAEDGISYKINIFLSVLNDQGAPLPELKKEDFEILEDGQRVEIQDLRVIAEEQFNIVLVVDTSSSMTETDIKGARDSAITFIKGLKPNDQVALVVFDDIAKNQEILTTDHSKVIERINTLSRGDNGACIYDALDSAVNLFSTKPAGSRAVILLTKNRKDKTAIGANCSDHSADEVVNIAARGDLHTPIYVYSIGLKLDTKDDSEKKDIETLTGFATKTGGLFKNIPSSSQLANTFGMLSTQLRSQYILTYNSTSKPGAHSLMVEIYTPGQPRPPDQTPPPPLDSDTRDFSLPSLPPRINFTSPEEGSEIQDVLSIAVSLTTQGDVTVERVAFEVNGVKAGEDNTKPFELELDAKQYPVGHILVSATAYGANNTELARASVNITRTEIVETPVLALAPTEVVSNPIVETITPAATNNNNSVVFMAIALGALSIVAIGVLIFFLLRQQKQVSVLDVENFADDDTTMPAMQGIPVYRKVEENRKAISLEAESDALGALTIEASDDSSLVGHRFEITTPLVTLGRSADNDLNFPNDKPVSRHHAEIYQISGKLYLREVEMADATGTAKPPKYGTFINQAPMGSEPTLLKTGDEIQLGKRVRLKFEDYSKEMDGDSLTYDDEDLSAAGDIDKTQDQ